MHKVAEFKQNSVKGVLNVPITFIEKTKLGEIISQFDNLVDEHEIIPESETTLYKLMLAYPSKFYEGEIVNHRLEALDFENHSPKNQFREISKCIKGILALRKGDILEIISKPNGFESELEYRSFCLETLEKIKRKEILDLTDYVTSEFCNRYEFSLPTYGNQDHMNVDMKKSIMSVATSAKRNDLSKCYSTIHKAKGLEATCVLVCARNDNELNKWLTYEKSEDNNDDYRLGYVAFSRARIFLAVACANEISPTTITKLEDLKFDFR